MDPGRGPAERPPSLAASPCKKRKVAGAHSHGSLDSPNLIIGIGFAKSNECTGKISNKNLHVIGDTPNPYEQVISAIGRTLSPFDEEKLILCFGFGDESTRDHSVFSFYSDNQPCCGFKQALARYRELVPQLSFAGPTSFAPIIETVIGIVENSGGQDHVLLIIADGQVTRNIETGNGQLSPQEEETLDAIVKASNYPLSIVLIGIGDGPWDMMSRFDDNIPYRAFDNFQFVSFTEQMLKSSSSKKEGDFALSTLMKSAGHFEAASSFQLDGEQRGFSDRNVLPPPVADQRQYSGYSSTCNNASVQKIASADSDMCDPLTAEGHKVTSAHRNPKFVEIDNVHHPDLESYLHMTESPSEELEDIECIEDRHGCRLKQEICSNDNGDISSTSDKTIVNWLSLPPGVVWRIWGSLCNDSDRQKMRFVSKEWYKEIPEVMARRPWVIGSGTIHGIFHSINGKSLSQMKFRCEIPDGSFYSSCSSFLVMQTDNEHFLWSPSNRMSLKLPLKTYEKIVMHEDSDSYAFAYSSGKVKFSYGRPQVESSWKQILCYDKSIGDICQCDNEYYAVSNMFRLYWLDQKSSKLELIGPEQTSNDIKKLLLDGNFPDHLFLADVNHELVIVAVGRNLRSVDLFKVLWISDRMTSLVRVPDLGIWSLFLGRNQAIALSADDFPGISPSTLYLALDPLMDDEEPTVQLYNLATRSVVDTGYPVHKLGSPFFYQPDIVSASVLYE